MRDRLRDLKIPKNFENYTLSYLQETMKNIKDYHTSLKMKTGKGRFPS